MGPEERALVGDCSEMTQHTDLVESIAVVMD